MLKEIITDRIDKIAFILCISESFILETDIEVMCEVIKFKEKGEEKALEKLSALGEVDKIDYIIQTAMLALENEMHFSRVAHFPSLHYSQDINERLNRRFKIRLTKELKGFSKPLSLCRTALHRLYKEAHEKKRAEKIVTHIRAFNTAFRSLNYRIKTFCLYLERDDIGKSIIIQTIQMMFSQFIRDALMLIKHSTSRLHGYDSKPLFDFYRSILSWWISREVDFSTQTESRKLHDVIKLCDISEEVRGTMKQLEEIDVMMSSIKMLIRKRNNIS